MFFGVEVSWLGGGRELFRYPTEEDALRAERYLRREHPDVKYAVFVGRRFRGMAISRPAWRRTG